MTIDSKLPVASGEAPKAKQTDPAKLKDAASQFEALLISQMLKSAREARETDDKGGDSMMDIAEQQLSQVLTAGGGLGLAKLVIQGISVKTDTQS